MHKRCDAVSAAEERDACSDVAQFYIGEMGARGGGSAPSLGEEAPRLPLGPNAALPAGGLEVPIPLGDYWLDDWLERMCSTFRAVGNAHCTA